MVRHLWEWTDPCQKNMISYQNSWIRKKLVPWYETSRRRREPRETAGEIILCHHGNHGIEIQIPSTSGDHTNVWVVMSRGPNRYVDKVRNRDPEKSPEEADYEYMQETDQEQAATQLDMSDGHIPIPERKWKDLIPDECSHRYTWESQISKFVSKLVRHENYREQGNRWSKSLDTAESEAQMYVPKGWKP